MYSRLLTEAEFIASFRFRKDVSLEEFTSRLSFQKRNAPLLDDKVSALEYFTKNNSHSRLERFPLFVERLYKLLVLEPEEFLGTWWQHFGQMPEELPYYFQMPDKRIYSDNTFQGKTNAKYGRVCRQLNFAAAYKTKRTNDSYSFYEKYSAVELIRTMFEQFTVDKAVATPVFYDKVCSLTDPRDGYKVFWKFLMTYLPKPSILNPYTYREILNEVFEGEVLFAPCMSWNSPQLAFYNSNFKHFISTDVIPSVVENGRTLHLDWQEYDRSKVVRADKTIDLYCCPSERLQERHNFIDRYKESVDAVLFCPPYFNLELYDGGEQSIESFPDYHDWLEGYWEETVRTCVAVMKPGARFGFIISNYKNRDKKQMMISDDMAAVCDGYMTLVNRHKVKWGAFKANKKSKFTDGNFEDLWVYEKTK